MNKQEYFKFAESFFSDCLEISRKKNADYTGDSDNPFANFESVKALGLNSYQGMLTRMMDKMMRISSFVKQGKLQVENESVIDTLKDLANYSSLLAGMISAERVSPVKAPIPHISQDNGLGYMRTGEPLFNIQK